MSERPTHYDCPDCGRSYPLFGWGGEADLGPARDGSRPCRRCEEARGLWVPLAGTMRALLAETSWHDCDYPTSHTRGQSALAEGAWVSDVRRDCGRWVLTASVDGGRTWREYVLHARPRLTLPPSEVRACAHCSRRVARMIHRGVVVCSDHCLSWLLRGLRERPMEERRKGRELKGRYTHRRR